MAIVHSDIGLQEPSTITNRVAAVTIDRNSTLVQQEILTLGDPESSLGLARVVDTTPASTAFGLVVREVTPQSTTVAVSSVSGRVLVEQNSTTWAVQVAGYVAPSTTVQVSSVGGVVSVNLPSTASVRVYQSTAADLNVTVAGYVAPSTTVQVSSLGGIVAVSPVSTASVRVTQSSASKLNVSVAGYSTTANVSSVGGIVTVRPSDTNWASSAGFHFDGSGNLNVAGTFSASTTVNVSSLAGRVAVAAQHATEGIVNIADSTNSAIRVNVVAGAAGGSTEVTVRQSTAADFRATIYQSTAADLNVTVAGYVAPSTTVSIAAFPAGLLSTAAPATESSALIVRQVGYVAPSTTVQVSSVAGLVSVNLQSTASVRVVQSTAADLNVTVAGYVAPSTTVQVSSVAGRVTTAPSDTNWASSAGFHFDVLGNLGVSPVVGLDSTFASGAKGTSGDTTIISSGASTRIAVSAYHFSIDSTTPTLVRLLSGSTLEMARWIFRAPSSVSIGANLAVHIPSYLYRTAAGEALVLNTDSTATVHYTIAAVRMT